MNPSNRVVRTVGITAIVALMTGCAGMQEIVERQDALRAPAPLNGKRATPSVVTTYRAIAKAADDAFERQAKDAPTMPMLIDAGIAAANANCRQWFGAVSEAERKWTQGEGNVGVFQSLITALLGASAAHHSMVAAYGIGATAWNSWNQNFRASILSLGERDVQSAILSVMSTRAEQLRALAPSMTYPRAVDALDDYSRICTPETAVEITKSALNATRVTVDHDGALKSVAK